MFFDNLLNKGVYLRFSTENGEKKLIGIFADYETPFLLIKSRGHEYRINKNLILEIREALGEVEP